MLGPHRCSQGLKGWVSLKGEALQRLDVLCAVGSHRCNNAQKVYKAAASRTQGVTRRIRKLVQELLVLCSYIQVQVSSVCGVMYIMASLDDVCECLGHRTIYNKETRVRIQLLRSSKDKLKRRPSAKKHKCNNLSNYLSMCLSISVSTLLWLYTNGFADMSTKWGDIILYNYSSLNSIVLYEATLCRRI